MILMRRLGTGLAGLPWQFISIARRRFSVFFYLKQQQDQDQRLVWTKEGLGKPFQDCND
jgi:hypothetical protein